MPADESAAIEELRSEIRYIEVLLGAAEARLRLNSPADARNTVDFIGELLRDKLARLEEILERHYQQCA